MPKSSVLLIIVVSLPVALLVTVSSCGDDSPTEAADTDIETDLSQDVSDSGDLDSDLRQRPHSPELEAYCGPEWAEVEDRIDAILLELTLSEKVSMMAGASILPIGGTWTVPGLERLGIPGLHMIDGPRGVSRIAGRATAFPVAIARGATWDPALERQVGAVMGRETRAAGSDVLLAPTINILNHPRWGRAQETYGEDPIHMGLMAVGFVEGVQQYVLASVKHFAVNSIEDTRFEVDVSIDERTLREVYLPHFRMVVQDAHAASVMSAYNSVNGEFCSENAHLLSDILRDEWRFQGFVESDWIWGTQNTVPAVMAGLDIEMPMPQIYGPRLQSSVEGGEVPQEAVDASVRRILRAQLCYRLDSNPPVRDPNVLEAAEHVELTRQVAQRGMVLLKNENNTLPLDRGSLGTLVVMGPLADVENIGDTGSSSVNPTGIVTPLEGLVDALGAEVVRHIEWDVEATGLDEATQTTVAGADAVVLVVGLTSADEGEDTVSAGDRDSMAISDAEIALIGDVTALNSRVIVVLEGGSAITMSPWLDQIGALLMAWYPGMRGGNAIADLLLGDVEPSGRLPIVFPRAETDLPPFDNESLSVTYSYFHGYRHLQRDETAPLFAFGFGLSYTTLAYGDADLVDGDEGTVVVEVAVTNTGRRPCLETVQLYVGYEESQVIRAVRDLRAFTQVALEPGETQTVRLSFPLERLSFWNTGEAAWDLEDTTYELQIGPNSGDIRSTVPMTVDAGAIR